MGKVFYYISLLALIATIVIVGSCDTDDYVINADGIQSDSATIYVPYNGNENYLTLSSFIDWWSELEDPQQATWLSFTPEAGVYSSQVRLSATANNWRRRSTRIIFHNDYMTDTVTVIQRASTVYEPGIIIYNENFGADTVTARTDISAFTGWGAYGRGISVRDYTGTGAFIQADVMSEDFKKQPHEIISSANNLELEPGGEINLPQLSKGTFNDVILTLYAAAHDGNSYVGMDPNSFYIEGSTNRQNYTRIPLSIASATGWQKIESEFKIQAEATNFYIRITNPGTNPVYIDDITLESGGKGPQTIGDPTPIVTTIAASEIKAVSAQIGGLYTLPSSIAAIDKAGIEWRQSDEAEYKEIVKEDAQAGEEFTITLTDLEPATSYTFRAFTVHNGNTTYGNILTFTTPEAGTEGR